MNVLVPFSIAVLLAAPGIARAAAAVDCNAAITQADMTHCAYESFLAASALQAASYRSLTDALPKPQADLVRRAQSAWLRYQSAACDLESSGVAKGSAHGMVRWNCMARMTGERAAQLDRIGQCAEGDLACVRRKP